MKLPIFQIDTFTQQRFSGNSAAVCPLPHWVDDTKMQAIACENNLSETAFIVPSQDGYHIRWFTPTTEVDLCGHATLAAAYVAKHFLQDSRQQIFFHSKHEKLSVTTNEEYFTLHFPALPFEKIPPPQALIDGLGKTPTNVYASTDYLAIFSSEQEIADIVPNMMQLKKLDRRGVIISAPGVNVDFVSRFFGPNVGVAEDPVTGSAHCTLTPYWAEQLNKPVMNAKQISTRGGELVCELQGSQVLISGYAITYLVGEIYC